MASGWRSTAQEIRKRIWPGFWFLSDGNGSLGNRLNFTDWHYMNQGWACDYWDGVAVNHEDVHKGFPTAFYAPDSFFVSGAASSPKADAVVHGTHPADDWHPGMACAATEEFWFTDQNNGPAIAKFLGDKAAISSNLQFGTGRGMWWGKLSIEAYRDLGASVMGVYAINFLTLAMQAVTFDMPEQEIRYYGGEKFDRRLTIHDDEFAPGKLEFAWKLIDPSGQEVSHKTLKFDSDTSLLKRERVTFNIPKVAERTQFTLDMALRKNGKLREHEQRIVEVWPKDSAAIIGVASGACGIPRAKRKPFWSVSAARSSRWRRSRPRPWPIAASWSSARRASWATCPPRSKRFSGSPRAAGASWSCRRRRWASCRARSTWKLQLLQHGFCPRVEPSGDAGAQGHGFCDVELRPTCRSTRGALSHAQPRQLPAPGGGVSIWTSRPMSSHGPRCGRCILGNGSILITQLPLTDKIDTEPMAAEMWRRILDYLGKDVYKHPQSRLAVLDSVSEPVLNRLKDMRADFRLVDKADNANPVTLVEMNQPDFNKNTEEFRKYVQDGGILVLHRARPEHQAWLADLTGKKVSVEIQLYRSWVDRQMIESHDGLAEGLSNVDFYWRPNVGSEAPGACTRSPAWRPTPRARWNTW